MIFLTVGTQFPFDRLVKAVDEAVSQNGFNEKIFAQIGASSYRPCSFDVVASMEKEVFDKHIREASAIIAHAGMGTITIALEYNKPLLVMPRVKKYNEVVNDHQVAIARKFEQLGHILAAYTEDEIPEKIKQLKSFVPQPRKVQTKAVIERISKFLNEL